MKIQVGKYTLCSDQFCYWILEEQPIESEKAKRETKEVRVGGYSTRFSNLLRSFKENRLKLSDATDMEELLVDLVQISDDMDAMDKAAREQHFDTLREKYGTSD